MSGHSKWHSIRHKKAAVDAKRGKIFTKIIKEVTVAARLGGGDLSSNPRLRTAVAAAKDVNMPAKNIENAIKKGTGEIEGAIYEELNYEGYGPGGVAVLVETTTDNRNRTTADVRHIFSKYGGSLGAQGSVAFLFERKGAIQVAGGGGVDEDKVMEAALEAGAEDVKADGEGFTVLCGAGDLAAVREGLEAAGFAVESAAVQNIPATTKRVEGKEAETLLKLLDALEDNDDVQSVSANFEMSDELIEQMK